MGAIIISLDTGRRTEYLTSFFLSHYALTIPIRGHDDRLESDFICVGLKKRGKLFLPDIKLIFWIQTKSQSSINTKAIEIESKSTVDGILNNKMPYFIAIANTKDEPKLKIYNTSERIALRHSYPRKNIKKIIFKPGMPNNKKMYSISKDNIATIYMNEPFLTFSAKDTNRKETIWRKLKKRIEVEYRNFLYASVGLGRFYRDNLPWLPHNQSNRIFYPDNGKLTNETQTTIKTAIRMLELTIINREKNSNPHSDLVQGFNILKKKINFLS